MSGSTRSPDGEAAPTALDADEGDVLGCGAGPGGRLRFVLAEILRAIVRRCTAGQHGKVAP